jgi:hypothetical protein
MVDEVLPMGVVFIAILANSQRPISNSQSTGADQFGNWEFVLGS